MLVDWQKLRNKIAEEERVARESSAKFKWTDEELQNELFDIYKRGIIEAIRIKAPETEAMFTEKFKGFKSEVDKYNKIEEDKKYI